MSSATLQHDPSVESLFNVAETETLALFEHLFFAFLEEFDVFASVETGRTRDHEPPELMRGFFDCYYKDIYDIRPVERELRNRVVWLGCGFDRRRQETRSIASSPTSDMSLATSSTDPSSRPPPAACSS